MTLLRVENRRFGFLLAGAFGLLFCARGLRHGAWSPSLAAVSGVLLLMAAVAPDLLEAPRRIWIRFGEAIGSVTHPVILGVVFFGVVTPAGFLRRRFGSPKIIRPLSRKAWKRGKPSYWIALGPARQPTPENLRRPF